MNVQIYRAALKSVGVLQVSDSKCNSSAIAVQLVREMTADACGERLIVVHLDNGTNVLGVECVASGGIAGVSVRPGEIFRGALLACASAIVLGHNHPSGSPEPSADDLEMTRAVKLAGQAIGIDVLDHVVVTRSEKYTSFRERGLL